MADVDTRWMPPQGEHTVQIGSTLRRALKARKGEKIQPSSAKIPERDYHAIRYNFRPDSTDVSKPGTIETKPARQADAVAHVEVERASVQGNALHFVGTEAAAKDVECVLLYDEDTGEYTLEKLDSFVRLEYDRTPATSNLAASRPSLAPTAADAQQDSAHSNGGSELDFEAELERDLLSLAEGDEDARIPAAVARRQEEEESEEDGAFSEAPPSQTETRPAPPKAAPPPQPKPQAPPKQAQTARKVKPAPPRPSPPLPPPALAPEEAQEFPAEEEELVFGQPARALARPSPPAPPPPSRAAPDLALPGGPSDMHLPVATNTSHMADDSDDEDEWDEIIGGSQAVADDEQEIDIKEFEAELEEQLEFGSDAEDAADAGDDDDFLAAAVSPVISPVVPRGIVSMGDLAAAGHDSGALDDHSDISDSDDDSDDD